MVVLIVEDEIGILTNLKNIVLNDVGGFEKVLDASDGVEAIDIIHREKIDILITDICIGDVNGIDVASELRAVNKNAGIIIVSAYDNKEYLKSAISMGVSGYIEKPVDKAAFVKSVKTLVKRIESHCKDTNAGIKICDALLSQKAEQLAFLNSDFRFYMCVFKIFGNRFSDSNVLEMISEAVSSVSYDIKFLKANTYIVIFYGDKLKAKDVSLIYSKIVRDVSRKARIMLVPGSQVVTADRFTDEYNELIFRLQVAFYGDYGVVNPKKTVFDEVQTHDYLAAFNSVISSSQNKADEYITKVYNELKSIGSLPPKSVIYLFRQFISMAYFHVAQYRQLNFSLEELIDRVDDIYGAFDDIYSVTVEAIRMICTKLDNDSIDKLIKKYILNNYSDPELSLGKMASNLHFSISWMCIQFKKITGMTINEYISSVRLEKSKALLMDTNLTAENVAHSVGFNDLNYFSKFFKKNTGMAISEYRKKNKN